MNDILNQRFQEFLQEKRFAGAAMLIRQNGREVYRAQFGERDVERHIPADTKTIFRLASMTKPVIAVAVMILADHGMLSIDDDISRYLPAFAHVTAADRMVGFLDVYEADPENPMIPKFNPEKLVGIQNVPLTRPLTIRHLLGHCGGMGQGPYSNTIYSRGVRPGQSLEERVDWMAQVPLDFQPGDFAGYSAGMAFDVLGRIVEVVSGKDLEAFVQDEICRPLNIPDLGFCLTKEQMGRLSELYEARDGTLTNVTATDEPWKIVNPLADGYYSGSAGMFSTVESYDRFVSMLANRGELDGTRILKAETAAEMSANSSPKKLEMSPGISWGLGMIVHEDPMRSGRNVSKGTFGWSGAYGCHFFIDPIRKISAVMMMSVSNIGGADSPLALEFENAIAEQFSE